MTLPIVTAVLYYLPMGLVNAAALNVQLLKYYSFLGLQFNPIQAGVLVYLAVSAVLAAVCWLGWRRRAVSGA